MDIRAAEVPIHLENIVPSSLVWLGSVVYDLAEPAALNTPEETPDLSDRVEETTEPDGKLQWTRGDTLYRARSVRTAKVRPVREADCVAAVEGSAAVRRWLEEHGEGRPLYVVTAVRVATDLYIKTPPPPPPPMPQPRWARLLMPTREPRVCRNGDTAYGESVLSVRVIKMRKARKYRVAGKRQWVIKYVKEDGSVLDEE